MVIDSSAIVAILLKESETETFIGAIEADGTRLISAASVVEAGIVLERRLGYEAGRDMDDLIREAEIAIAPVDAEQAQLAREAFRRFGRGNHPAGLNFGDCFSYALAQARSEPLLYKGGDFSKTDITAAVKSGVS